MEDNSPDKSEDENNLVKIQDDKKPNENPEATNPASIVEGESDEDNDILEVEPVIPQQAEVEKENQNSSFAESDIDENLFFSARERKTTVSEPVAYDEITKSTSLEEEKEDMEDVPKPLPETKEEV